MGKRVFVETRLSAVACASPETMHKNAQKLYKRELVFHEPQSHMPLPEIGFDPQKSVPSRPVRDSRHSNHARTRKAKNAQRCTRGVSSARADTPTFPKIGF